MNFNMLKLAGGRLTSCHHKHDRLSHVSHATRMHAYYGHSEYWDYNTQMTYTGARAAVRSIAADSAHGEDVSLDPVHTKDIFGMTDEGSQGASL